MTTYNTATAYTSRRLIALPIQVETWGKNDLTGVFDYTSKVTYAYDEGDFSGTGQNISPVQHDNTNFGSGFIAGRGNVTKVTRHDVLNGSTIDVSRIMYNTAGSPVSQTDPLGRTVNISYTDSFNSSGNPTTYAYPTTLTDPANFSSTIQYRWQNYH